MNEANKFGMCHIVSAFRITGFVNQTHISDLARSAVRFWDEMFFGTMVRFQCPVAIGAFVMLYVQ